jgi:hypothetical protein
MIQRMFFGTTGMASPPVAVVVDMALLLPGRDASTLTNMFVTSKFAANAFVTAVIEVAGG